MGIKVGFSKTNSLISRSIRWFTDSDVSHCYIRMYDPFLESDIVIHSDWPGVVIIQSQRFLSENTPVEEFEIFDPNMRKAFLANLKFLGNGYRWKGIWHRFKIQIFRKWFKWLKRKIQNLAEDPKKMICVDFVLHNTNDAGITNLPFNVLTSNDLLAWFRENYSELGMKRIVFDNPTMIEELIKAVVDVKDALGMGDKK